MLNRILRQTTLLLMIVLWGCLSSCAVNPVVPVPSNGDPAQAHNDPLPEIESSTDRLSLREAMIALEDQDIDVVREVIPLGPYYTSFSTNTTMADLVTLLVAESLVRGGMPEVWIDGYDSFTGKDISGWAPVLLRVNKKRKVLVYNHPVTGRTEEFHFGHMIETSRIGTPDEFPPRLRMRGSFRLAHREVRNPLVGDQRYIHSVVDRILIRHDKPQPFVFKLRKGIIPEPGQLVPPPDNLESASGWDFRAPGDRTWWEKVQKWGHWIGLTGYEHLERPYGQHMPLIGYYLGYAGLCQQTGGVPLTFVRGSNVNRIIIPAGREFYAMLVNEVNQNTDLIVSCEGGQKEFAVNIHTFPYREVEIQYRANTTFSEIITGQDRDPIRPLTEFELGSLKIKDDPVGIHPLELFRVTRFTPEERFGSGARLVRAPEDLVNRRNQEIRERTFNYVMNPEYSSVRSYFDSIGLSHEKARKLYNGFSEHMNNNSLEEREKVQRP